jgi:hypothetical protein
MSMRWHIASKALEYFRVKRNYTLANKFLLGNYNAETSESQLAREYLKLCDKHDNLAHEFITVVDRASRLEAENINGHRIAE